jgi:hypothetical protein
VRGALAEGLSPVATETAGRPRRSLAPLIAVTTAAAVFVILLVLIRAQWAPARVG